MSSGRDSATGAGPRPPATGAQAAELLGENHRFVRECLQLQRIAGRVQEEAGRLLPRLAHEADLRLDDETDVPAAVSLAVRAANRRCSG